MDTTTSPAVPLRILAAYFTLSKEARRDRHGKLIVYKLPAADGGGTFEVAGINDGYHGPMAEHLRDLITAGKHDEAERNAVLYIAQYCDPAARWCSDGVPPSSSNSADGKMPSLQWAEAFLRDCVFNRGPKGGLRILQLALGVADDGKFGPKTRAALAARSQFPERLLTALRSAREKYERRIAPPVGKRAKFWPGLVQRWDAALDFARTLL